MRNLTRRELSIISGGMKDQTSRNYMGSQLTCGALVTGASKIVGTGAAIGAVVITKNPATAMPAYRAGVAGTSLAGGYACGQFMDHNAR